MRKSVFLFLIFLLPLLSYAQKKRYHLDEKINEASGLFIENTNKYWWINDSGDQPVLYQTNGEGKLQQRIKVTDAKHVDWEDLTGDNKGHLYIGDFGNNSNARKDLAIYKYHLKNGTVEVINFNYPDQAEFPPQKKDMNFDMEGFFWHAEKLHLFSKNKVPHGDYVTKHYILSDQPGQQVAVLLEQIKLPKNRVITAAAISPDKQTIALLSYNYGKILNLIPWGQTTIYFIRNWNGDKMLSGNVKTKKNVQFMTPAQYEGIDFLDNDRLIIASEQIMFTKQRAKRIRVKK